MNKTNSKRLCHYTTLDALKGMIMGNKEFWFSNALFMNDTQELTYCINELKECYLYDCKADVSRMHKDASNRFTQSMKYLNSHYPYIMCFSKCEDDAAQWERYANRAQGVCVEFNSEKLEDFLYKNFVIYIQEVNYNFDVNETRPKTIYEIIKRYIDEGVLPKGYNNQEDISLFFDLMIIQASSYKHPSFASENEKRAILLYNRQSKNNYIEETFSVSKGVIKKIAKIKIGNYCENNNLSIADLIDRIVIGPNSQQNEDVFIKYLKTEYKDIEVVKSNCPLRLL